MRDLSNPKRNHQPHPLPQPEQVCFYQLHWVVCLLSGSKCICLPIFTFDDQVGEGNEDLNCGTAPAHNDSVDDKTAVVSDQ